MRGFGSALTLLLLLSSGCATVQTGRYGSPLDARGRTLTGHTTPVGLKVSARELTDYSSAYFGALVVTFENTSSRWVRVRKMSVRFATEPQNRGVMIPYGDELESWVTAADLRHEMRRANTQLVLSGVALGGSLIAAASGSSEGQAAGGAVAAGALTALAADQIGENRDRLEAPGPFPESHLMAVPFAIPPGLFSRRWVVLNTPGASAAIGCVTTLTLEYETESGRQERVSITFRELGNRSEWQRRECSLRPRRN